MIKVKNEPKEHENEHYGGFTPDFLPFGQFWKHFGRHCIPHPHRGKFFGIHDDKIPRTHVTRDHEKYTIQIELPGISKDEIELEVTSDEIWLEARNENLNKTYSRNISLRIPIESTMVKASIKAGLLTIIAPLVEKREKRRIDID